MNQHPHAHHDHAGHGHDHAHQHGAAHPPRRETPAARASLLRASATGRLGAAALAIAMVWGGVFWAMS